MYADLGVKPVENDPIAPAVEPELDPTRKKTTVMNLRTRKNNTMNILNEALARARMRELWRDETRGYVGRHRGAREIATRIRRRESR